MKRSDDANAPTQRARPGSPTSAQRGNDEPDLVRRAGSGEQPAFDLLYDRYFARTSWYFTIFGRREAKTAVAEVMTTLFGSLGAPSEISFAERAYRLALATELRHSAPPKTVRPAKPRPAKRQRAASGSAPLP